MKLQCLNINVTFCKHLSLIKDYEERKHMLFGINVGSFSQRYNARSKYVVNLQARISYAVRLHISAVSLHLLITHYF